MRDDEYPLADSGEADTVAETMRLLGGSEPPETRAALARTRATLFSFGEGERYVLGRELGRGGRGVVFAAFDRELQRDVAIKFVRPAGDQHEAATASVRREALALARLSHPNVVQVFEVSTSGAHAWGTHLVMELVEGRDLRRWLRERPRSQQEILQVFLAAGRGLVAAHEAGIVHRDFKPENVLIAADGRVLVADFGLARFDQSEMETADDTGPDMPSQALAGTFGGAGTPDYMAPEQHDGARVDARADQYAFCVALYEALAGTMPFVGSSATQLRAAKRDVPRQRPSGVPRWLWPLLVRGLAPTPRARHASLKVLLGQLQSRSAGAHRTARWTAVGSIIVAAGLSAPSAPADTRCDTAASLENPWRHDLRPGVAETFANHPDPRGREGAQRWLVQLDDYVTRWASAHERACASGHPPVPVADDTRHRCLQAAKRRFFALAEALHDPDAVKPEFVGRAVASLPPPDRCTAPLQVGGFSTDAAEPAGPDAGAAKTLDRARVLADLGIYEDARSLAEAALAELPESSSSLQAEVHLVLGEVAAFRNDFGAAQPHFHDALLAAERAGDEGRSVMALLKLGLVTGLYLRQPDEGGRLLDVVQARLHRYPSERFARAELAHARGMVAHAQHQIEDALRFHEQALALHEELLGPDHPETAQVLLSLGADHILAKDHARARPLLERAMEVFAERYGPTHPRVGHCLGNLGRLADEEGRLDDALDLQERALAIHRAAVGDEHPWIGRSLLNIARTLRKQDRLTEARSRLEEALAVYHELKDDARAAEVSLELEHLNAPAGGRR